MKTLTQDLNIFVTYSKFMLGICSLEHFGVNKSMISRETSAMGHTENLL